MGFAHQTLFMVIQLSFFYFRLAICCILIAAQCNIARSDDYTETTHHFRSGAYEAAEASAAVQVDKGIWNERWPRVLIESQLAQGKYAEAAKRFEEAVKRYPTSLTMRSLGAKAYRFAGKDSNAEVQEAQIFRLLQSGTFRYASRDNLVAAGRFFARRGEDARRILELFYDRVIDSDPEHFEAYIATAELALSKSDFKVAAETLSRAEKVSAQDARTAYMLARAFSPSDTKRAEMEINRALELNPNHIPSLIFQAEAAIDREQYQRSETFIARALEVNDASPEAWALKSVLSHLSGEKKQEIEFRKKALQSWKKNPAVDYVIGRLLSRKYRFAEGAQAQRRSLAFDPDFLPAKFQLAQDLLRLGKEEEGWKQAEQTNQADPYNVVAHNLMTLQTRMSGFTELSRNNVLLKMASDEAVLYGEEALDLLVNAKQQLCDKYEIEIDKRIVVEIFPQQKDFAIRTFGLPGGAGYLGVCFGPVITANSPASQGSRPANWKSVLWHEFCHVVTLEKTRNRMPRWLSEGISVYEERLHDPSWGESMTSQYREMMLGDDLTPISGLSGAFLNPSTPLHLQFAYYESSLVVEYIVEQNGIGTLVEILDDLGNGILIRDAFARHLGSPEKLDAEFTKHARGLAAEVGPQVDWSRDVIPEKASLAELKQLVKANPTNYWILVTMARQLIDQKDLEQALEHLETLDRLGALTGERNGPMELLARVYGELGKEAKERATHMRIVEQSSNALPSLQRLIELALRDSQWDDLREYATKVLAINPLIRLGHESLAIAFENSDKDLIDTAAAIQPLSRLLQLSPDDPAGLHYRIASAYFGGEKFVEARRHVLLSLSQAPRYLEAHRLLLEIIDSEEPESEKTESAKVEPETSKSNGVRLKVDEREKSGL